MRGPQVYTERSVPKRLTWTLAISFMFAWIPLGYYADTETKTQELRRCEQEALWLEDEANGLPEHARRGQPPSEFLSCPIHPE